MTRIVQRGSRWWIEYRGLDGRRRRESAAGVLGLPRNQPLSARQAEQALQLRVGEVAQGRHVEARWHTLTLGDCLEALRVHRRLSRPAPDGVDRLLARIKAEIGSVRAQAVTGAVLEGWAASWLKAGLAPATAAGRLSYVGQALRLAVTHRRLAAAPPMPRLSVRNARQGFLGGADFEGLLGALRDGAPDLVYLDAVEWAYRTAWRREEILGLTWPAVDREAGEIRLERTKNGDTRVLPIQGHVRALIERRWKARGLGVPWVFHLGGRRVNGRRLLAHFRRAAARIGRPELILHDLRRSAVRNMEQAGVPRSVAMKISGHRSEGIYKRYAIVSTKDVAEALRRVEEAR